MNKRAYYTEIIKPIVSNVCFWSTQSLNNLLTQLLKAMNFSIRINACKFREKKTEKVHDLMKQSSKLINKWNKYRPKWSDKCNRWLASKKQQKQNKRKQKHETLMEATDRVGGKESKYERIEREGQWEWN